MKGKPPTGAAKPPRARGAPLDPNHQNPFVVPEVQYGVLGGSRRSQSSQRYSGSLKHN